VQEPQITWYNPSTSDRNPGGPEKLKNYAGQTAGELDAWPLTWSGLMVPLAGTEGRTWFAFRLRSPM